MCSFLAVYANSHGSRTSDAASEVLRVPPSDIEAPPEVFGENELKYVTGVGKLNGRLVILIDVSKILEKGEFKRLGDMPVATTV